MSQVDFATFSVIVFWTFLIFGASFLLFISEFLPLFISFISKTKSLLGIYFNLAFVYVCHLLSYFEKRATAFREGLSSVIFSSVKYMYKLYEIYCDEVISLFTTFFTKKILEAKESVEFSDAYSGIFGQKPELSWFMGFKGFSSAISSNKNYTECSKSQSRVNCTLGYNCYNVSLLGVRLFTRSQNNCAVLNSNVSGAWSFQRRGLATEAGRLLTFPFNFYKLAQPHIDKSLLAEDVADKLSELVQTLKNLGILWRKPQRPRLAEFGLLIDPNFTVSDYDFTYTWVLDVGKLYEFFNRQGGDFTLYDIDTFVIRHLAFWKYLFRPHVLRNKEGKGSFTFYHRSVNDENELRAGARILALLIVYFLISEKINVPKGLPEDNEKLMPYSFQYYFRFVSKKVGSLKWDRVDPLALS